jgi:hypothetical protein
MQQIRWAVHGQARPSSKRLLAPHEGRVLERPGLVLHPGGHEMADVVSIQPISLGEEAGQRIRRVQPIADAQLDGHNCNKGKA